MLGDSMADWLAYGLEEAFAEDPEIGVVRKIRRGSGLIRYESKSDLEWKDVAKDTIADVKPQYIVVMLGLSDRRSIRDEIRVPVQGQPAAKKTAPQSLDPQAVDSQTRNSDGEATRKTRLVKTGPFSYRSDKWQGVYIKRIDETIAALKASGVPVFWVGLPSVRGTRSTSDMRYFNEMFRGSAEKAGIVFVDLWDGFVKENGRYTSFGPDHAGQTRRLRTADGVYFTKPGARKLAFYVEREISRVIANRAKLVALPSNPEDVIPEHPGGSAPRPLAGPVLPLTATYGMPDEKLLGGAARPRSPHSIATRVLKRGEALSPPRGRADYFVLPGTQIARSCR